MKKLFFITILCFTLLTSSRVYASCYKVSDVHSLQLIEYTTENYKYQDTSKYKVEAVGDDSFCKSQYEKKYYVSCGKIGKINKKIPEITSWLITLVEVVVPVLLAIFGAIDFVRAIVNQKEEEIKKSQSIFIKRVITAVLIFFIVAFAKVVVSFFSSNDIESGNIINCIDCFMSNKCS